MYTRIYIPYRVYFLRETSSKLLKKSPISRTYSFRRERSRNKMRKSFLSWLVEFSERLCIFIYQKKKDGIENDIPSLKIKYSRLVMSYILRFLSTMRWLIVRRTIRSREHDSTELRWKRRENKGKWCLFEKLKKKKQRKRKRTRLTKLKVIRE